MNKLIIRHLNINSLRNNIELLAQQIKDNVDILMISETKLDESFPTSQFFMNGFSCPHRLDRNCSGGGGILLYIRQDIPSKLLSIERDLTEAFFVEINLHNGKKWLISCSYNPKRASFVNHLSALSKCTDIYSSKYDNLIFLGDFNAEVEDTDIKNFCSSYNLASKVNMATCYENLDKPTFIDLILTNSPGSFQNSCVVETGLSDFYKMVVTVMKTSYRKSQPKIIHYRSYKNFSNDILRDSLQKIFPPDLGNNCDQDVDFLLSWNKILDQYAPRKKKYVRGNHSPFMNKNLSKAIMLRTKLRNIFLKNRTEENKNRYTKQRNLCVTLLRKSKRIF